LALLVSGDRDRCLVTGPGRLDLLERAAFVSGTLRVIHTNASTENPANTQNVPAWPMASVTVRKNWLTSQALPQFAAVASATPRPRDRTRPQRLAAAHCASRVGANR
jgi:hypothetical protein